MQKTLSTIVTLAIVTHVGSANATTEIPSPYDARSAGMGSTGVAYIHGGASVYHNPGALAGVEGASATLVVAPTGPQLSAPLDGANTDVQSERKFFPMFLAGGAYQLDDHWVFGLAGYPTMGFGATYENVAGLGGQDLAVQLAAFEVAPAVSYSITDKIAIGAAYRITYMFQSATTPGAPAPAETSVSGTNFLGAHLGIFARPAQDTRLGLSYRSKVNVNMKGTTTQGGVELPTETSFASPHQFKIGIAQAVLARRLLLALDLKYCLYREANRQQVTTVTLPDGSSATQTVELDWENTMALFTGAEYRFAKTGPAVRLGYSLSQSATPEERANPVMAPPDLIHAVHAGAGTTLSQVDLDLGGFYGFAATRAQPSGGLPGEYGLNMFLVSASATYRM